MSLAGSEMAEQCEEAFKRQSSVTFAGDLKGSSVIAPQPDKCELRRLAAVGSRLS
jgi:hypothetical protein